ncbi:MAG: hypothetical protein HY646_11915 [Acidobacteria bacterium]|nr:hypothetical protein [Acidobacteriota bacterium]
MSLLLTMVMSLTLAYWHKDITGHGCGLCHVRYVPVLHSPIADGSATPAMTDQNRHMEVTTYEPEVFTRTRASRAPPLNVLTVC